MGTYTTRTPLAYCILCRRPIGTLHGGDNHTSIGKHWQRWHPGVKAWIIAIYNYYRLTTLRGEGITKETKVYNRRGTRTYTLTERIGGEDAGITFA